MWGDFWKRKIFIWQLNKAFFLEALFITMEFSWSLWMLIIAPIQLTHLNKSASIHWFIITGTASARLYTCTSYPWRGCSMFDSLFTPSVIISLPETSHTQGLIYSFIKHFYVKSIHQSTEKKQKISLLSAAPSFLIILTALECESI